MLRPTPTHWVGAFMLKLQGKTAFVFGVASEDSIAWAICQQLAAAGVTLYLGYQKRFMSRIFQLKDKLPQIGGFYPRCGIGCYDS